jgi:D-threonate/D-erythronate kinase
VPSCVRVAAHTTFRLGLIADDLTGANDTAVQFARRGWDTLLALDPTSGSAGLSAIRTALAVTTDSRALDNAAAAKLTSEAIAHLMDAGVDRIYLKIDSTMRGSVAGQIDGALAAWRTRHSDARAVVCPRNRQSAAIPSLPSRRVTWPHLFLAHATGP